MKFTEIISRLNGVSTPIFGVSWTAPKADVTIAKKVILFLEDRRVLYARHEVEEPSRVVDSILQIRQFLTSVLGEGQIGRELESSLRTMRATCRKFLDAYPYQPGDGRHHARYYGGFHDAGLNQALGEFRGSMGHSVAFLAVKYGIDIEAPLDQILPVNDEEST